MSIAWRACRRDILGANKWRALFLHPAHGPLAPPLFATYFEEDDGAEDARKEQNNKNDDGYSALEREICAATL